MLASLRKSVKPSRFTRKFGTAEKIQTYVNKYLNQDGNLKIENLLTNPFDFTHAAVVDYIRKNRNMYLEYGPESVIHEAFMKLCRAYDDDQEGHEPFFRIIRGDIFDSKFEKPSFRKIKCLWVFYELLKILKDKKNKGNQKLDLLDFFEEKVQSLNEKLQQCHIEKRQTIFGLDYILGVGNLELLIYERPVPLSSSSKTRKNSSRSGLKK
jgi:hypothetical protein